MKTVPKILIVVALAGAIALTFALKGRQDGSEPVANASTNAASPSSSGEAPAEPGVVAAAPAGGLPRLVDLGADKCVPCKMMAPILDEMKEEFAGRLDVQFIDVWKNPEAGEEYGVRMIPTQIFYDASGKELFRHTGFFAKEDILAKWKELGVDLGATPAAPAFSRWEPAEPDTRDKATVCYLCDGDIDPKTRAVMKTAAGDVAFCSPHCYVITFASLTDENKSHAGASVTDWAGGGLVPVTDAVYLYGMDELGRPTTKAFADEAAAKTEQSNSSGNVLAWDQFESKETANLCGFCDRPVYPEDASVVRVEGGMKTWGCCPMCALGVAARTGKNIETVVKDALTGEPVRVKTFEGHVAELDPDTAVAWGGARKDAEGAVKSTGCFKQAFFTNEANLKKWVKEHPTATGRELAIEQALAAKMRMTPEQIGKACKIGECCPK